MDWTIFWTLTLILTNLLSTYYLGYLKGKKEVQQNNRNVRNQIFNDILQFKNAVVNKKLMNDEPFEEERLLLLKLFNYVIDKENERNQTHGKSNN